MQTITLKIKDDVSEKFLWLLSHFSQNEIEIINTEIIIDNTFDSDTKRYVGTKEFEKDKAYFQKCLEDIETGKTKTISHDEVWTKIEKNTQVL